MSHAAQPFTTRQRLTWPFAPLTERQQLDRIKLEAALRAGRLPRWPGATR